METFFVPLCSVHQPPLVSSPPVPRDPRTRVSKLFTNLQKVPRLSQETQDLQAQDLHLVPQVMLCDTQDFRQESMLLPGFPWRLSSCLKS